MKRRKFATAGAFLAALLAVAVAAASVSAATSAPKASAAKNPRGSTKHAGIKSLGKHAWVSGRAAQPAAKNTNPYLNKIGRMAHPPKGKGIGKGGSVSRTAGAPVIHGLPVVNSPGITHAFGLNAFEQSETGGYSDTPPDDALAEGNTSTGGYVFQAVNNVFRVYDNTGFGHKSNVESMENFFYDASFDAGYDPSGFGPCGVFLSDPKAHYDYDTHKWFVTEVAYNPGCQPGSQVFIAVSVTDNPLGSWYFYILDVSFDGVDCANDPFLCLGDQPLLGMNKKVVVISTNSYDWFNPGPGDFVFNGAQVYAIDKSALASGFNFPGLVYWDTEADFGGSPDGIDGCGLPYFAAYPISAFCWYSLQPATSPNLTFAPARNGTEFLLSALDFTGSGDTRIALWGMTDTGDISNFVADSFLDYTLVNTEAYSFPPDATQPSSGDNPLCELFNPPPFCQFAAPIASNDDRMNEVKSVYNGSSHPAFVWGGLNTGALIADPINVKHLRVAVAWFSVSATCWIGIDICGGAVNKQGYIGNWAYDALFPAPGIDTTGGKGAIVYSLTGAVFPSVAISKVDLHVGATKIQIVIQGADQLDDFGYLFFGRPRFGDYSAAVGDGHTMYGAAEMVQYKNCTAIQLLLGGDCGDTRSFFTNWGTGLVKVNV